jgi:hypothetical protein
VVQSNSSPSAWLNNGSQDKRHICKLGRITVVFGNYTFTSIAKSIFVYGSMLISLRLEEL